MSQQRPPHQPDIHSKDRPGTRHTNHRPLPNSSGVLPSHRPPPEPGAIRQPTVRQVDTRSTTLEELFKEHRIEYPPSRQTLKVFAQREKDWRQEDLPELPTDRGGLRIYVWLAERPSPQTHFQQCSLRLPTIGMAPTAERYFSKHARAQNEPQGGIGRCPICASQLFGYATANHRAKDCPYSSLDCQLKLRFMATNLVSFCQHCKARSAAHYKPDSRYGTKYDCQGGRCKICQSPDHCAIQGMCDCQPPMTIDIQQQQVNTARSDLKRTVKNLTEDPTHPLLYQLPVDGPYEFLDSLVDPNRTVVGWGHRTTGPDTPTRMPEEQKYGNYYTEHEPTSYPSLVAPEAKYQSQLPILSFLTADLHKLMDIAEWLNAGKSDESRYDTNPLPSEGFSNFLPTADSASDTAMDDTADELEDYVQPLPPVIQPPSVKQKTPPPSEVLPPRRKSQLDRPDRAQVTVRTSFPAPREALQTHRQPPKSAFDFMNPKEPSFAKLVWQDEMEKEGQSPSRPSYSSVLQGNSKESPNTASSREESPPPKSSQVEVCINTTQAVICKDFQTPLLTSSSHTSSQEPVPLPLPTAHQRSPSRKTVGNTASATHSFIMPPPPVIQDRHAGKQSPPPESPPSMKVDAQVDEKTERDQEKVLCQRSGWNCQQPLVIGDRAFRPSVQHKAFSMLIAETLPKSRQAILLRIKALQTAICGSYADPEEILPHHTTQSLQSYAEALTAWGLRLSEESVLMVTLESKDPDHIQARLTSGGGTVPVPDFTTWTLPNVKNWTAQLFRPRQFGEIHPLDRLRPRAQLEPWWLIPAINANSTAAEEVNLEMRMMETQITELTAGSSFPTHSVRLLEYVLRMPTPSDESATLHRVHWLFCILTGYYPQDVPADRPLRLRTYMNLLYALVYVLVRIRVTDRIMDVSCTDCQHSLATTAVRGHQLPLPSFTLFCQHEDERWSSWFDSVFLSVLSQENYREENCQCFAIEKRTASASTSD
ncbi:unnamed protein product [Caenorhabditis nigoni]|uniref:Uncharacterized protein n=1 Tax=Caenorhabditis nigoni TaxID=1611254 RepID=A0A2G5SCU1_9PELO|nr:hypothetical protein B9Z55_028237 [Caenorhabditis nigoni]